MDSARTHELKKCVLKSGNMPDSLSQAFTAQTSPRKQHLSVIEFNPLSCSHRRLTAVLF